MTLVQKQQLFAEWHARLILQAIAMGYAVTLGEAWRPDETARAYAKLGIGIDNSLHRLKLATDINLWRDGVWLQKTEDHRLLGEWWQAQSTPYVTFVWGGTFGDGNHYSFLHNGVR